MKYSGVLAPTSRWRPTVVPRPKAHETLAEDAAEDAGRALELDAPRPARPHGNGNYRPFAELLARERSGSTSSSAPRARAALVALITEPSSVRRDLTAKGEPTDGRAVSRGRA